MAQAFSRTKAKLKELFKILSTMRQMTQTAMKNRNQNSLITLFTLSQMHKEMFIQPKTRYVILIALMCH